MYFMKCKFRSMYFEIYELSEDLLGLNTTLIYILVTRGCLYDIDSLIFVNAYCMQ